MTLSFIDEQTLTPLNRLAGTSTKHGDCIFYCRLHHLCRKLRCILITSLWICFSCLYGIHRSVNFFWLMTKGLIDWLSKLHVSSSSTFIYNALRYDISHPGTVDEDWFIELIDDELMVFMFVDFDMCLNQVLLNADIILHVTYYDDDDDDDCYRSIIIIIIHHIKFHYNHCLFSFGWM